MTDITDKDLPALFRAADHASLTSQWQYIRIVRANLALMVLGAFATCWAATSPIAHDLLALCGTGTLLASFSLTTLVLQLKPDKRWFNARATAESAKTLAWRYMAGAEPFQKTISDAEADKRFSQKLATVLGEPSTTEALLGGLESSAEEITDRMREIRSSDLDARKRVYLDDRITSQRVWYAGKAQSNARSSVFWLTATGSCQLAGAIAAMASLRWPGFQFNFAAAFAALAAAAMAWVQVKRHQELSHAYGLAAHELGVILVRARHVTTEGELSVFVADAENAISREHTMWVARRDAAGLV